MATPERDHVVLVVEDDDDIRNAIRDCLDDEGFTVLCAENGRIAMDLLAGGRRPCLIMLDMMMPVMDGWQVLDALNADPGLASIAVVVVSAAGDRMIPSTVREVIAKPPHIDKLIAAARKYC